MLQTTLARDRLGEYQAQAAIAALHADARRAEETDWVQIVEWYDELVRPHRKPSGPPQPGGRGRRSQRTAGRSGRPGRARPRPTPLRRRCGVPP